MSFSSISGEAQQGGSKLVDPFSGMGKAMPALDEKRSPLPFGAVPHAHLPVRDAESPDGRHLSPSNAHSFRTRKEREPLPEVFPSPQYSIHSPGHAALSPGEQSPATRMGGLDLGYGPGRSRTFQRAMSVSSNHGLSVDESDVGTDAWMANRIADCVEQAKGDVNLSGKGLTRLSSNIAQLRDLVTLSTRSPPSTPFGLSPSINSRIPSMDSSPVTRAAAGPSPYAETFQRAPPLSAKGPVAFSNRSFSRTASAPAIPAPASSNFFHQLNNGTERVKSQLSNEASSSASPPLADQSALQPSPSIDAAGLGTRTRTFGRSKTARETLQEAPVENTGGSGVKLNISNNRLTKLPSALFELNNLVMLSLRHNELRTMPAGIGELTGLDELNIANNQLTELPATILNLRLNAPRSEKSDHQAVRHFPNPWMACNVQPHPESERYLGPLIRHYPATQNIPTLSSLCWAVVMSPRQPDNVAPLVNYDFEMERGKGHPLNDPVALQSFCSHSDIPTLQRVQQAARSSHTAAKLAASKQSSMGHGDFARFGGRQGFGRSQSVQQQSFVKQPIGHYPSRPYGSDKLGPAEDDDASLNPYFEPCPSPRHAEYDEHAEPHLRPTRRLFLHAAEERIEWREVLGLKEKLPIRWKGCSPGCLDFLEVDENNDVDGFDLSDTEIDE